MRSIVRCWGERRGVLEARGNRKEKGEEKREGRGEEREGKRGVEEREGKGEEGEGVDEAEEVRDRGGHGATRKGRGLGWGR